MLFENIPYMIISVVSCFDISNGVQGALIGCALHMFAFKLGFICSVIKGIVSLFDYNAA